MKAKPMAKLFWAVVFFCVCSVLVACGGPAATPTAVTAVISTTAPSTDATPLNPTATISGAPTLTPPPLPTGVVEIDPISPPAMPGENHEHTTGLGGSLETDCLECQGHMYTSLRVEGMDDKGAGTLTEFDKRATAELPNIPGPVRVRATKIAHDHETPNLTDSKIVVIEHWPNGIQSPSEIIVYLDPGDPSLSDSSTPDSKLRRVINRVRHPMLRLPGWTPEPLPTPISSVNEAKSSVTEIVVGRDANDNDRALLWIEGVGIVRGVELTFDMQPRLAEQW